MDFLFFFHVWFDCQLVQGAVAGAALEVVVVGLDIFGQIDDFAGFQLLDAIEDDCLAVVIFAFIMPTQANLADVLAAFSFVSVRDLIFREDGFIRALGYARSAIDAGIWVDVVPGPLFLRLTRYDTFYRTYIDATGVAQAQAGNYMRHGSFLLKI
jgi:hypothetical protein